MGEKEGRFNADRYRALLIETGDRAATVLSQMRGVKKIIRFGPRDRKVVTIFSDVDLCLLYDGRLRNYDSCIAQGRSLLESHRFQVRGIEGLRVHLEALTEDEFVESQTLDPRDFRHDRTRRTTIRIAQKVARGKVLSG